jgi:hypothetical protein
MNAASVQASRMKLRGPVGVQIVTSASIAIPPAINEMVMRLIVAIPRACRCELNSS